MSGREWKPGDVALVTSDDGERRAIRTGDQAWSLADTWSSCLVDAQVTYARPLVVIDAEDREQVRGLADAAFGEVPSNTNRLQAALRSLITPPKPEEPQGLGAVVEDAHGHKWTRVDDVDCENPWHRNGSYDDREWPLVSAVRVLSEGVAE